MHSDETEPLPWYYALGLVALGLVLLVVVGVTATVVMAALSSVSLADRIVERGELAGAPLEGLPSPTEAIAAMVTDPGALIVMTTGGLIMALFAAPYLEWKRRQLLEADRREGRQ